MNTQQAKRLSLPDVLAKLGHQPVRSEKDGFELWYLSPFRVEKVPSFHTSYLGGQWIWNDFGDIGGNIIDFVIRHKGTNVKGALAFLGDYAGLVSRPAPPPERGNPELPFPKNRPEKNEDHAPKLVFERAAPLQAMLNYVSERAVDTQIAKRYVEEVFYRNAQTGKAYYAIGIKNRAGGYEIRNPYFKSSLGSKDLTLIEGRVGEGVVVFEGFMDFLSYLTDLKQEALDRDALILNSASFEKPALEFIKERGYSEAHLFFDNDRTGLDLTERFVEALDGVSVMPQNHRYHPHKDYNEMLMFRKKSLSK